MNWRAVLIGSLGLNLLLAALWLSARSRTTPVQATDEQPTSSVHSSAPEIEVVTKVEEQLIQLPGGEIRWPLWDELADDNLLVQRTNLLAIGCPEETVHDLLSLTLFRRLIQDRYAFMTPHLPRFWDLLAAGGMENNPEMDRLNNQMDEQMDEWNKLGEVVLAGLAEPNHREAEAWKESAPAEPQYAHLSEEKQRAITAMQEELIRLRSEAYDAHRDENSRVTPEGRQLGQQIEKEYQARMEALMTAEERTEWRLRASGASQWASQLRGFEPSAGELRQIAGWQMSFDEEHRLPNPKDPTHEERLAARKAAEEAMNERTRELLGDERFVQLERAKDENYSSLYDVGLRFEMPEATVNQAWQMQQEAEAAAQRVRQDQALSNLQRRDALRAIQQETRTSFQTLLGEEPFQTYQDHGGNWLGELARIAAPQR